jgi:hypothetical protein
MVGLVELAQRYVALSAELEETRNAVRDALTNGSDENPTRAGSSGPPNKELNREAFLAQSTTADERVLALPREKPMKAGDFARATGATSARRASGCEGCTSSALSSRRRTAGAQPFNPRRTRATGAGGAEQV